MNLNYNAKAVPNMTPDGFNTGFVQGNLDCDIDFEIAVENLNATPKIEELPFDTADVALNFVCGADQYICSGLFCKTMKEAASGIGQEAKKNWTFGALKATDAVGNSVLFNLSL